MKISSKKALTVWILIFLNILITFNGCARIGHDFNENRVQNIQIGKTTKDDLISMFGQPWRKGIDNGVTMWTYGRYTYRVIGEADTKDLIVKFDKDGKVSSYTFNTTIDK